MNPDTNPYQIPIPEQPQPYPPAIEPAPKKNRLLTAVLVVALLAMLAGGAAFAYLESRPSPEERLYKALENHLSTGTLLQEWENKSDYGEAITFSAQSDFSDPTKPKVAGSFFLKSESLSSVELGYETISLPNDENYAKLTSYSLPGRPIEKIKQLLMDKWFAIDKSSPSLLLAGMLEGVNTASGEVITGNFEPSLRNEIMTKIKADKIYTIKDQRTSDTNKNELILNVTTDADKLKDLNKFWTDKLDVYLPDSGDGYVDQAELTIDTRTNRLVRVEIKKEKETIVITYSKFGEAFDIKKPAVFMTSAELANLLSALPREENLLPY